MGGKPSSGHGYSSISAGIFAVDSQGHLVSKWPSVALLVPLGPWLSLCSVAFSFKACLKGKAYPLRGTSLRRYRNSDRFLPGGATS